MCVMGVPLPQLRREFEKAARLWCTPGTGAATDCGPIIDHRFDDILIGSTHHELDGA